MKKYEFLTLDLQDPADSKELNNLGSKGWKLVGYTATIDNLDYPQYHYVFQRKIIEPKV